MVLRQSYFYFNMDQPLDLVVREKPIDSVTAERIERTRQPFPSSQDFAEGGRFAHLKIPYFPPVPMEILRYLYGDDVTYEMVSPRDQANLLRCLPATVAEHDGHLRHRSPGYPLLDGHRLHDRSTSEA